jgi:hypothetical protein
MIKNNSKNDITKIVYVLEYGLQVFKSQGSDLELIYNIKEDKNINSKDKFFNLSEYFGDLFIQKISPQIVGLKLENYLFINEGAGFMNSRIVYLWLTNLQHFDKVEYFVTRTKFNQSLEQLLAIKKQNNKDLAYTKEPNIGIKN